MQNRDQSRLASIITLILGIWVIISPIWISMSSGAITSTVITGVVIGIVGVIQFFESSVIPSWISGIAAIWLFISAFTFSISDIGVWILAISAIIVFLLAVWDGSEITLYNEQRHVGKSNP